MSFLKNLLDGGKGEAQKKNEAGYALNQSTLTTQYGLGEQYLQQMMMAIEEGKTDAKANLASQGTTATNAIIENAKKTLAANKQGLISSGLSSTTLGPNLANQTHGETSAALAGLGEQLGALHAGVDAQYASQKASGLQSLASFAMGKVGAQNAITPQYTAGPGLLAGLGSGIGQFIGNKGLPKPSSTPNPGGN